MFTSAVASVRRHFESTDDADRPPPLAGRSDGGWPALQGSSWQTLDLPTINKITSYVRDKDYPNVRLTCWLLSDLCPPVSMMSKRLRDPDLPEYEKKLYPRLMRYEAQKSLFEAIPDVVQKILSAVRICEYPSRDDVVAIGYDHPPDRRYSEYSDLDFHFNIFKNALNALEVCLTSGHTGSYSYSALHRNRLDAAALESILDSGKEVFDGGDRSTKLFISLLLNAFGSYLCAHPPQKIKAVKCGYLKKEEARSMIRTVMGRYPEMMHIGCVLKNMPDLFPGQRAGR